MPGLVEDVLGAPLPLPCGVELPNRFVKSAMSENVADAENAPTDVLVKMYDRLGRGGTGLLITGNVIVAHGGLTEDRNVVLEDDRHLTRYARWAAAAQANGAHAWVQLSHAGRQSPRLATRQSVAPSAVKLAKGGLFSTPRELTDEEIRVLINRFARAARVVKEAGFSGVQIHGAHGYLVSQFLSPLTNRRTDRWGGDIEGRMRFLLEIVQAIRTAVGPRFPIGVKLNSADFQRGGFSTEDSLIVAKALEKAGIDLLEISGGTYESPKMAGPSKRESTRRREAFFLEYAERIRKAVKIPLLVTGGFRTAGGMVDAVESGAIDLVGLARPLTIEPDLPKKLLDGTAEAAMHVDVGVGIRMLDDLLQVVWHQAQLIRMGEGREPNPRLGRWSTLLRMVPSAYWRSLLTRFRQPPAGLLSAEELRELEGAAG